MRKPDLSDPSRSLGWPVGGRHALILSAGFGTRLGRLAEFRAKPVVPVAGEPLVRRILRWLVSGGVIDVVLNLHHLPHTITRVVGDGSDVGARVRYSWENPILGSAGGPRQALSLLDADWFFVVNGDTLTDVDLGDLARAHAASGALVTMAVSPNHDPVRYGGVVVDRSGAVTGFTSRGAPGPCFHFVGVQATCRAAFEQLAAGERVDSVGSLYPALIAQRPGSVRAFMTNGLFFDVGTARDYLAASVAIARAEGLSGLPAGTGTRLDPGARLVDTLVWDDVVIDERCSLTRCIVGEGVHITAGTSLTDRVVVRAGDRRPIRGEQIVGELLLAPLDPPFPAS